MHLTTFEKYWTRRSGPLFGYMDVRAIVAAKPLERIDELTMGKGGGKSQETM